MEARFKAPAQTLLALIETLNELTTEANLHCNAERGLSMQAMDNSHVSFFLLHFPPDSLEHFRCQGDFTMGLRMDALRKMLKCAVKNDIITLQYNPASSKRKTAELLILIESAQGTRLSDFSLHLIDIEVDTLNVPDVEHAATVTLPMPMLQRVVKDFKEMGDTLCLSVGKLGFKCSFSGDVGSGCVTMAASDAVHLTVKEAVTMSVSSKYLSFFCKAASFAEHGVLSFHPDMPLRLACGLGEGAGIDFFLAPKIEE